MCIHTEDESSYCLNMMDIGVREYSHLCLAVSMRLCVCLGGGSSERGTQHCERACVCVCFSVLLCALKERPLCFNACLG